MVVVLRPVSLRLGIVAGPGFDKLPAFLIAGATGELATQTRVIELDFHLP
jgi:hypothetical protein